MQVQIKKLIRSTEFQGRPRLDQSVVNRYAQCYLQDVQMPPVLVAEVDGKYYLCGGYTRVAAQEKNRAVSVECIVTKTTRAGALRLSAEDNWQHGQPLDNKGYCKSFLMWIAGGGYKDEQGELKSCRQIAKETGARITDKTVL